MSETLKFSHITLTWKILIAEAIAIAICMALIFLVIEPGGDSKADRQTNAILLVAAMVVLIGGGVLTGIGRSTFEIQHDGLVVADTWMTPISFFAPRGQTFIRWDDVAAVWNSVSTVRAKGRTYTYAHGHVRSAAGREFKFSADVSTRRYAAVFRPFYEALRQRLPRLNLNPLPIVQG